MKVIRMPFVLPFSSVLLRGPRLPVHGILATGRISQRARYHRRLSTDHVEVSFN